MFGHQYVGNSEDAHELVELFRIPHTLAVGSIKSFFDNNGSVIENRTGGRPQKMCNSASPIW
jgi:hypothetical protein